MIDENECCPKRKAVEQSCLEEKTGKLWKSGEYWTSESDPCTHLSCQNGTINSYMENCAQIKCQKVKHK